MHPILLKNLVLVRILLVLDAHESSTVKHVTVRFWENLFCCRRLVSWIVAVPQIVSDTAM
jgi:hypothetical protein